jgi:hypothetical protein
MPDIFMSPGARASFQVMGCESYLLSRTPNGVTIFYNKLSPPSCCSRLADQRLNRNNWNRKFDSRQGEDGCNAFSYPPRLERYDRFAPIAAIKAEKHGVPLD